MFKRIFKALILVLTIALLISPITARAEGETNNDTPTNDVNQNVNGENQNNEGNGENNTNTPSTDVGSENQNNPTTNNDVVGNNQNTDPTTNNESVNSDDSNITPTDNSDSIGTNENTNENNTLSSTEKGTIICTTVDIETNEPVNITDYYVYNVDGELLPTKIEGNKVYFENLENGSYTILHGGAYDIDDNTGYVFEQSPKPISVNPYFSDLTSGTYEINDTTKKHEVVFKVKKISMKVTINDSKSVGIVSIQNLYDKDQDKSLYPSGIWSAYELDGSSKTSIVLNGVGRYRPIQIIGTVPNEYAVDGKGGYGEYTLSWKNDYDQWNVTWIDSWDLGWDNWNDKGEANSEFVLNVGTDYFWNKDRTIYLVAKGDNSIFYKSSNDSLLFTFKDQVNDENTFDKFIRVLVDGVELSNDKYVATKGSVNIELKSDYLKTLADGLHEIMCVFEDGNAFAYFTVKGNADTQPAASTSNNDSSSSYNTNYRLPKTGVE
jgi:hypothetical protein